MTEQNSAQLANLRLLQLCSPTLPVGAFAYSQGLEWAVEAGWVSNQPELQNWLRGQLQQTLAHLDLPVLRRLYAAATGNNREALAYWSAYLLAGRETSELRLEEQDAGQSLLRLLKDLGCAEARDWDTHPARTVALGFALAAHYWSIACDDLLAGYAWSRLENQTLAGVKLIPLGQLAGQRTLQAIAAEIPAAVETSRQLADDELGASPPAVAISSAQHETQYTRLFRS